MLNRHRSNRSAAPVGASSTAGLLLSLISALPDNQRALARSARALAHRLTDGTSQPADIDEAARLMTVLLDATDTGLCFDEDGLLDEGFDA